MKKRWKITLSRLLVLVLTMQSLFAGSVFGAENVPAPETVSESSVEEGIPSDENTAPSETPADSAPGETVSGNDGSDETVSEDDAAPDEIIEDVTVSEDTTGEISENETVSEDEADDLTEENSGDAETETKNVTVMLYAVGSDLERNSLASRMDLTEIMEGIAARTNNDSVAPSINFIVQTGGMKQGTAQEQSAYSKLIEDRKTELAGDKLANFNRFIDAGLDYTKNQRWELSGDSIKPALNDEGVNRDRAMTGAVDDVNEELLDFIDTTTEKYPAKQYILIFWDHGSGPMRGFGQDERKDDVSLLSNHVAATMKKTQVFGKEKKKLAWIGYDACLMANIETAITWAPYARFFSGSEELEGNDGWDYVNWVKMLCTAAAEKNNDFTDQPYVDRLVGGVTGKGQAAGLVETNIDDFVKHYKGSGNATQSLVDLSEINDAGLALKDYADALLPILEDHPLDAYWALRYIRSSTKGFGSAHPHIMDLNDFISRTKDSAFINTLKIRGVNDINTADINKLNTAASNLETRLKAAVISENHTSDIKAPLGGLTVFFPYVSPSTPINENEREDEWIDYRSYYENSVFSDSSYVGIFGSLDSYRDLVSLYLSIRDAGEALGDNNAAQSTAETAFNASLSKYKVSDLKEKSNVAKLPSEVASHRIQNEAIKICVDATSVNFLRRDTVTLEGFDQQLYLQDNNENKLFLGYLPSGAVSEFFGQRQQQLTNHNPVKWFEVESGGKKYPLPVYFHYLADGSVNALTDYMDIFIPVANTEDNSIYMLDYSFNGGDTGTLNGYLGFSYEYAQFERYVPIEGADDAAKKTFLKNQIGDKIALIGNLAESLDNRSGVNFNHETLSEYAYATDIETDDLIDRVKRNVTEFSGASVGNYKVSMNYVLKDIFDTAYIYKDSYKEKLSVSVKLKDGLSGFKKGDYLKRDDIELSIKDPAGKKVENYTIDGSVIPLEKTLFCMYDDHNTEIPITEDAGYLWADIDGKGSKKIEATPDTTIFLSEKALDIKTYSSIDCATEDLDSVFTLVSDTNKITLPVYDPETDNLNVSILSTPYYYLAYKASRLSITDFADYFSVKLGNIDVTKDKKLTVKFAVKEDTGFVSKNATAVLKSGLKPGAEIAAYVEFEGLNADNESNPLVLKKSPAKIVGTEPVKTYRLQNLQKDYSKAISVTYYDAKNNPVKDVKNYNHTKLSEITTDNSATIDTKGIDKAISANYLNIPLSANGTWKPAFSDYFEVTEFVLSEYHVLDVKNVRFLSSVDRSALSTAVSVPMDKSAVKGRIQISDNALVIKGDDPVEWYFKAGTANPVIVYKNDEPASYRDVDLVEKNNNGKWMFYLPENFDCSDVIFYAGYAAKAENQGDVEAVIDPITPVEYTGRDLVTTKSGKSGSKVIGLVVRSADKDTILTEGTDYTVTYKNNKKVADINDSKAPTLIIKGKNDYKGLKYKVNFSILPADFANASISVNRKYVALNKSKKKGINLEATVKLPGGKAVPASRVELHFYKKDDNGLRTEVTRQQLASYYTTNKYYPLYVSAKAIQPADENSNYVTGSRIDPKNEVLIYAYPKSNGKPKVTLKKSKYDYNENGTKIADIFTKANIKKLKAGNKTVSTGQIRPVKAYYDSALTKPVDSDVLVNAGTYYLDIGLTDKYAAQYRYFNSAALKVTIVGTKIKKKNVALTTKKIKAVSGNEREPESLPLVLRFASDFEWNTLKVRCKQRDQSVKEFIIHNDDEDCEERDGMLYYTLKGVDNGAVGNYSITVYGTGAYSGNISFDYKVTR
ncbi:MAG: hypothetical protein K6F86_05875 [Lachnospiraceae bacterium]|nr:hypothetical protein [Lachnospiraceae bacterium]